MKHTSGGVVPEGESSVLVQQHRGGHIVCEDACDVRSRRETTDQSSLRALQSELELQLILQIHQVQETLPRL